MVKNRDWDLDVGMSVGGGGGGGGCALIRPDMLFLLESLFCRPSLNNKVACDNNRGNERK